MLARRFRAAMHAQLAVAPGDATAEGRVGLGPPAGQGEDR